MTLQQCEHQVWHLTILIFGFQTFMRLLVISFCRRRAIKMRQMRKKKADTGRARRHLFNKLFNKPGTTFHTVLIWKINKSNRSQPSSANMAANRLPKKIEPHWHGGEEARACCRHRQPYCRHSHTYSDTQTHIMAQPEGGMVRHSSTHLSSHRKHTWKYVCTCHPHAHLVFLCVNCSSMCRLQGTIL